MTIIDEDLKPKAPSTSPKPEGNLPDNKDNLPVDNEE